jgi:hypothetical protein
VVEIAYVLLQVVSMAVEYFNYRRQHVQGTKQHTFTTQHNRFTPGNPSQLSLVVIDYLMEGT